MTAVPAGDERLSLAALNRALLARQGLLERLDAPLGDAVEAIGPLQAQHWPALPHALWSRVSGFAVEDLYAALDRGDLVLGTLLRNTLHLVSAREHPDYAAVVAATGADDWRRTDAPVSAEAEQLRADLLRHADAAPRTGDDIAAFIEDWVAAHPDAIDAAEVEHQRKYKWRAFLRWSALVRAPGDGQWGAKAPAALLAAPRPAGPPPAPDEALDAVVLRHLRAFGPAGAEDVASFIGWRTPPVRAALERLGPELVTFADEGGRPVYDLPDAPRPDAEMPAPPRLLAAFDSALLAYAPARRARILPDRHRDAVYERKNLRIRPTFLLDGVVAGIWALEVRRREAVVTLHPFARLAAATRKALVDEADRLARGVRPETAGHRVVVER